MKTCNQFLSDIPEILDGSAPGESRDAFNNHIASCPDCAEAYHQYRATLDVLSSYDRPPELADGEEAFLDRLDRALDAGLVAARKPERTAEGAATTFKWLPGTSSRIAIATAAALVAGLFIGHELFSPGSYLQNHSSDTPAIVSSESIPGISAEEQAEQYLGQAELVLLSMVNTDIEEEMPYRPSFDRQRSLSRDLLNEAVFIREGLETGSPEHERFLDLMDTLEVILMQIAALDADYTADDLAFIQSSAERKAVLFKMNLDAVLAAGEPNISSGNHSENIQPIVPVF